MNQRSSRQQTKAFTKVELLVVLLVLAIFMVLLIPALGGTKQRVGRIHCINNLKEASIGMRLAVNKGSRYSVESLVDSAAQIPGIAPQSVVTASDAWMLFQRGANGFSSPRALVCPSDSGRLIAGSFGTNGLVSEFQHPTRRLNSLSYFISVHADEGGPQNIQLGDRYLTTDPEGETGKGTTFLFGQQDLGGASPTAGSVRWISTIHGGGGNAALMDGSAQQLTTLKLRQALTNQPAATNRIWLPNSDATGRGNP